LLFCRPSTRTKIFLENHIFYSEISLTATVILVCVSSLYIYVLLAKNAATKTLAKSATTPAGSKDSESKQLGALIRRLTGQARDTSFNRLYDGHMA
jgi:hypothetical protein